MSKIYTFEEFLKVAKVGMKVRSIFFDNAQEEKITNITESGFISETLSVQSKNSSGKLFEILSNDPWNELKVGDIIVDPAGFTAEVVAVLPGLLAYLFNNIKNIFWKRIEDAKELGWTIKDSSPKEKKKCDCDTFDSHEVCDICQKVDLKNPEKYVLTNEIIKTIKESLKSFDKEFTNSHPGDSGIGGNYPQEPVYELQIDPQSTEDINALKSHLLQSQIVLLEVEVESLEKRKWLDKHFGKEGMDEYHKGYNHGLEYQISSLEEVKKKLLNN